MKKIPVVHVQVAKNQWTIITFKTTKQAKSFVNDIKKLGYKYNEGFLIKKARKS